MAGPSTSAGSGSATAATTATQAATPATGMARTDHRTAAALRSSTVGGGAGICDGEPGGGVGECLGHPVEAHVGAVEVLVLVVGRRPHQRACQRREAVVEQQLDVLGRGPAQLREVSHRHPAHVVQHERPPLHPRQPLQRGDDDGVRSHGRTGDLLDGVARLLGPHRRGALPLRRDEHRGPARAHQDVGRAAQRGPGAPHPHQRGGRCGPGDPRVAGDRQRLGGELRVRRRVERRELIAKTAGPSHPKPPSGCGR